jgi:deoxyribose-phosphate aldolase
MTFSDIASSIDHTNLKAEAKTEDIVQLCNEAIDYQFAAVCIHPCHVSLCSKLLHDTQVGICTVVGFPLGVNTTETKVAETLQAIKSGATEIDLVINVGKVKDGDDDYFKEELVKIRAACGSLVCLKVILEMSALNDSEKRRCAQMSIDVGVDYLKTSTGTHKLGGATVPDAELLMSMVDGNQVKVKAAGGIRELSTIVEHLNLGVDRIGTSSGISIIKEFKDATH